MIYTITIMISFALGACFGMWRGYIITNKIWAETYHELLQKKISEQK